MEFIEAPAFSRYLPEYLDAESYRELQFLMARDPLLGDIMPGTGGFRKLRWVDPRRGKGKRGGLRLIYFYFVSDEQIWLMTIYDKNEAQDLTTAEKKMLKVALEGELKRRASRKRKLTVIRRRR